MPNDLETKWRQIVDEDGPWTAHNIDLGQGVFTIQPENFLWQKHRAEYYIQLAEFSLRRPIAGASVLDLGSLEGGMTVEFARRGAKCVGLEIRPEHLRKANFAREALGLDNLSFVQGDMLRMGDALGDQKFDVVLCAGVLYHVDANDLLPYLKEISSRCAGVAIIDTHISLDYREAYKATDGLDVYGSSLLEHSDEAKAKRLWASWDNKYSFWPTERSLANLLAAAGFSYVVRPIHPYLDWTWSDRDVWLAHSPDLFDSNFKPLGGYRKEPDPRLTRHPGIELSAKGAKNPATKIVKR
jgi:predicted RNA methylase